MSVDYEAVEHHEAQGEPEYWKMLEEQYGNKAVSEITRIELTPMETAALIVALQASKGMAESEEMYELLESVYTKVYLELEDREKESYISDGSGNTSMVRHHCSVVDNDVRA
jgi:predicted DNA-binding transcriptional regulator YafY